MQQNPAMIAIKKENITELKTGKITKCLCTSTNINNLIQRNNCYGLF